MGGGLEHLFLSRTLKLVFTSVAIVVSAVELSYA